MGKSKKAVAAKVRIRAKKPAPVEFPGPTLGQAVVHKMRTKVFLVRTVGEQGKDPLQEINEFLERQDGHIQVTVVDGQTLFVQVSYFNHEEKTTAANFG